MSVFDAWSILIYFRFSVRPTGYPVPPALGAPVRHSAFYAEPISTGHYLYARERQAMAGFYVWETADLSITLQGETNPLENYSAVVVSICQKNQRVDMTQDELGIDVEAQTINIHLTQEQTGAFQPGSADIQVNIYYADTERDTSAKGRIDVLDNLYKKVMP